MKKEVIVAVVSGLILGLIITLGIYTANKSINKIRVKKQVENQTDTVPSPPLAKTAKKLSITSHQNFDLIDQSKITLSGIAWPEAVIALISETDNQLITADKEGIFSFNLDLINGFNELTIIATDETNKTESKTLILTYSTTKIELEDLEEPTSFNLVPVAHAQDNETEKATDSSITDKIKERLQDTAEVGIETIKDELLIESNTPKKKAFIGQITNIGQSSIELEYKSFTSSITLKDSTQIVKSKGKTTLDLKDLKVEDFLICFGFVYKDSESLQAQRILQIEPPKSPQVRQLITGKIEEIDSNKVVVDNKRLTVNLKTNLDIKDIEDPEVEDLELDDNLFAIATLDQNGDIDEVKNILVIPGKNNPAALEPTNQNEATDSAEATESAETE